MQQDLDTRMRSSGDQPVGSGDALTRIVTLERGLQNFEQQVAEQLEKALNDMSSQVFSVEQSTATLKSMTQATNEMVQKLDQPF